jgi:putative restriction endonuclease
MDDVGPLRAQPVFGRLEPGLEAALRDGSVLLARAARALVEAESPPTLAPEVLTAVGLDPDVVLGSARVAAAVTSDERTRSRAWVLDVLAAWDRQCAFCGYDGQLGLAPVGLEAANVRWFTHGGPDGLDNGLALCALHHRLLDRGALGLTADGRVASCPQSQDRVGTRPGHAWALVRLAVALAGVFPGTGLAGAVQRDGELDWG